ncbi:LADA_0B08394g1_1 [Lachancea dasiensis]|uniref:LADA_0B08394g1_1 n=1 Tax=Lachancea dasiensis TaxID=1072105 RepID=A0A1G4IU99_9SACH|nr:LADA_0B08394g1_1 [Lachancea dasiensis]
MVASVIPVVVGLAMRYVAAADSYSELGCYSQSDLSSALDSKGSYTYQSTSYCENECDGSEVVALLGGDTCYCGDSASALSSVSSTDSGNCDTKCAGWPYDTCGGSGYFQVYLKSGVTVPKSSGSSSSGGSSSTSSSAGGSSRSSSSASSSSSSSSKSSSGSSAGSSSSSRARSSSSSSASSRSSSSSSSSSSKSSSSSSASSSSSSSTSSRSSSSASSRSSSSSSASSTSGSSSSSASRSSSDAPTTVTTSSASVATLSNNQHSTRYVTQTTVLNSPTASGTSAQDVSSKSSSTSKDSLSGGAIAGIVIGSIVGSLLVAGLVFFLLWRRRKQQARDLEETKHHQPYSFGDSDGSAIPAAQRNASVRRTSSELGHSTNNDYAGQTPVFDDSYGRIRLSDGSLPDVTQEHGPLRIVNPDTEVYPHRNY